MTLMEWNIHGMGGYGNYSIPVNLILETIEDLKPDSIVLLEFIECSDGFKDLKHGLEQMGYELFITKYISKANGVLIAVKTEYKPNYVCEKEEYLEVSVQTKENLVVSIIGMRIFSQGEYSHFIKRKELLESRLDSIYAEKEKNFILMLDANNGAIQYENNRDFIYKTVERSKYNYQYIWRLVEDRYKWSLVTPDKGGRYVGGKYSIVTGENIPENYHTKEDHIISSFEYECFTNVDYYWDFVKESNGYGKRKPTDYLSDLISLPDHGVLVAKIDL